MTGPVDAPNAINLTLTLAEAWACRDFARQHNEYGRVWSRTDMLAVHAAVLYLEANRDQASYDVELTQDTLWLLEQQIPSALMVGLVPVGRQLLVKVMAALALLIAKEEDHDDDQATEASLPSFIERWEVERAAAERGFQEWEKGS